MMTHLFLIPGVISLDLFRTLLHNTLQYSLVTTVLYHVGYMCVE